MSSSLGYVGYEMRGVSCLMTKQSSIKKEDKVERGIGSEQSKLRLSVTVGDSIGFDFAHISSRCGFFGSREVSHESV